MLPKRGRKIFVLIEGEEYEARLFHNEWHFVEKEREKLGFKTMNDHYEWGLKITDWRYPREKIYHSLM